MAYQENGQCPTTELQALMCLAWVVRSGCPHCTGKAGLGEKTVGGLVSVGAPSVLRWTEVKLARAEAPLQAASETPPSGVWELA